MLLLAGGALASPPPPAPPPPAGAVRPPPGVPDPNDASEPPGLVAALMHAASGGETLASLSALYFEAALDARVRQALKAAKPFADARVLSCGHQTSGRSDVSISVETSGTASRVRTQSVHGGERCSRSFDLFQTTAGWKIVEITLLPEGRTLTSLLTESGH